MLCFVIVLLQLSTAMQYIPILHACDNFASLINNFASSSVVYADDTPFEHVTLPWSYLFYDRRQDHVWISPNGALSFIPGAPCDSYFSMNDCSLSTSTYEAFHAPFLTDLCPYERNDTDIVYGWDDDHFVVRWENIATYDQPSTQHSFLVSLNRDGSAYYIYKSFEINFSYTSGLVGSRPFFTLGNYTRRSAFMTSSYKWGTGIDGNYVTLSQMLTIANTINNQKIAGIDDYAYSAAVLMCLMPTRFCVYPFNVGVQAVTLEVAYDVIACGNNQQVQFRCYFGNSGIYSNATLIESEQILECQKPAMEIGNETIQMYIAVSSIYYSDWSFIDTENRLLLRTTTTTPQSCSSTAGETCSQCGICGNGETALQCIGTDGVIFGETSVDCPAGQVMDREGVCCAIQSIDCIGVCNGTFVAGYSTPPLTTCCQASTLDCAGVCGGTANYDACGVCSGGSTGHVANSDMDCMGVCFGNYTDVCDIEVETDVETVIVSLSVTNGTTVSTVDVVNKRETAARLTSISGMDNTYPPITEYSLYVQRNGSWTSVSPYQTVLYSYQTLRIQFLTRLGAILTRPNSLLASTVSRRLNFTFVSMRPVQSGEYDRTMCSFTLRYHVTDCYQISNTRSCTLLPGCVACLLTYSFSQEMDYLNRILSVSPSSGETGESGDLVSSDEIRFVTFTQPTTYTLSCYQGENVSSCSKVMDYVEANEDVLNNQSFSSIFRDASSITLLVCFVIMLIILLIVWDKHRKLRALDLAIWELYEENYDEYREVISIMHEESAEE